MKKFALFIVLLLAGFFVVNASFQLVISKVDWNFRKAKEAFDFRDRAFNVVVLGNSTAMDGVNTEMLSDVFGPSYNFAVGGASLETNYIQLSKYLENNRMPSKVLIFLSSCHLNYNKVQEINPIIDHYFSNSDSFPTLTDMPLFKFRWLFIENAKQLISEEHRKATIVDGQLRLGRTVSDNTAIEKSNSLKCLTDEDYSSHGYLFLRKTFDLCQKYGIAMAVFEMPCWKRNQNSCSDIIVGDETKIYNLNNIDVCATVIDPMTHWLSEDHLNYSGSVKLTEYIIKILKNDLMVQRSGGSLRFQNREQ